MIDSRETAHGTQESIHTTTQELLDAMAEPLTVWSSLLLYGPLQPGNSFNPGSSAEHTPGLPHGERGVNSVATDTDRAAFQLLTSIHAVH